MVASLTPTHMISLTHSMMFELTLISYNGQGVRGKVQKLKEGKNEFMEGNKQMEKENWQLCSSVFLRIVINKSK